MRTMRNLAVAAMAAAALALAGCGGGGGKVSAPQPPTPVMVALPADLPMEYAPSAGTMTIPAGSTYTSNGVVFSCASGGDDCAVTVAADGMVSSTGGMVTASLTQAVTDIVTSRSNEATRTAQRTAANTAITAAQTAVAGVNDDSTDPEVASAEMAVEDAEDAVDAATALTAAERAELMTLVTAANNALNAAKTSRTAAMDAKDKANQAAMAKLGKELFAAMGTAWNTGAWIGPGANGGLGPQEDGTLSVRPARGAGALPDGVDERLEGDDLAAGASAGSLHGWAGTDYAGSEGTGDSKFTYEARVYTNRGAPTSTPFGEVHAVITADGANKGYLAVSGTEEDELARVMAAAFTHSGTQDHPIPARSNAFYVRGTYDGAPGEYRCTGTCTSTNDGSGAPSALAGTWHFKPDAGAMVSQPDDVYLYYGWWVVKDSDGVPKALNASAGAVPAITTENPNPTAPAANPNNITGSATYVGGAAGKFAMNNPLTGTGDGGHFTADAELTAKFGDPNSVDGAGVTGTIDNFRLNDGSEDPGWSVELTRTGWSGTTGSFVVPSGSRGSATVWSIDGNKAPASGTWNGRLYDEMPGNPPDGDGSNIPTSAVGSFYSEFSTFGRMTGAFGVTKQ